MPRQDADLRIAIAVAGLLALAACKGGAGGSDPGSPPDAADPGIEMEVAGDDATAELADRDAPAEAAPEDPGTPDPAPVDPAGDPATGDPAADPVNDAPADAPADKAPDVASDPSSDAPAEDADDLPTDVPPDAGPWTVTVSPALPQDAVASYLMNASPAAWNLFGGADLPLGRHWDEGHVGYHAAIRFPGVPVPPGATIESATLTWYPTNEVDSQNILWLQVAAEKAADSPPLSLTDYQNARPDQRLRTDAKIAEWAIRCNAGCTDRTEYDCPQRRKDCWDRTVAYACPKDLKALVQEVVSLPGWAAGNALTLFLDPSVPQDYIDRDVGSRSITGVDPERGDAFRPALAITYR